jgi:hypothetical protein
MWMSKSGLFLSFFSKAIQSRVVSSLKMVGLIGLEPMTPALSRRCSNQLSYRPNCFFKICLLGGFPRKLETNLKRWWRLTDSNR